MEPVRKSVFAHLSAASSMESFNLSLDDDHVHSNPDKMEISGHVSPEPNYCEPSTSFVADSPFSLPANCLSTNDQPHNEPKDSQSTRITEKETMGSTAHFKTPLSVPSSSKPSSKQTFSSSKVQIMGRSTPRSTKTAASPKKNPTVKIASFAKASAVDRLAPTSASSLDKPSVPSHFMSQNNPGGSKQLITQTSLPTPALNSALRSFFNYASQSEASPSTDASHSDEEDEDEDEVDENIEEEEILVYMQFDTKLDSDLLQSHTPFKIIGIDSDKPVLQLGNQVFQGNWSDTIGTAVFFEENPSASSGDPVFTKNPPSTLNYHSKTQKSLVMSRIFVKPKEQDEDGAAMVPMAIVEVPP